jgi:hypothetical protein
MANDIITPGGTEIINIQQVGGDAKAVTLQSIVDLGGGGTTFKGVFADISTANAAPGNVEGDYSLIYALGGFVFVEGVVMNLYADPSTSPFTEITGSPGEGMYSTTALAIAATVSNDYFTITTDGGATCSQYRNISNTPIGPLGSPFTIESVYNAAFVGRLAVPQTGVSSPIFKIAIFHDSTYKFDEAVQLTGAETIAGVKTFSDELIAQDKVTISNAPASGNDAVNKTYSDLKALTTDVLEKTNVTSFTPTADYHPATKKYVDDNDVSAFTVVRQVGQQIASAGYVTMMVTPTLSSNATYRIQGQCSWTGGTIGGTATFSWKSTITGTATYVDGHIWCISPAPVDQSLQKLVNLSSLPLSYGNSLDFISEPALSSAIPELVHFDIIVQTSSSGTFSFGFRESGTSASVACNIGGLDPAYMNITKLT